MVGLIPKIEQLDGFIKGTQVPHEDPHLDVLMFSFSQIEGPFVVDQLQHDHRFAVTKASPKRRRDGGVVGWRGSFGYQTVTATWEMRLVTPTITKKGTYPLVN